MQALLSVHRKICTRLQKAQLKCWHACRDTHSFLKSDKVLSMKYKTTVLMHQFCSHINYTAKLLFHQSPARHSDYTVTTPVMM